LLRSVVERDDEWVEYRSYSRASTRAHTRHGDAVHSMKTTLHALRHALCAALLLSACASSQPTPQPMPEPTPAVNRAAAPSATLATLKKDAAQVTPLLQTPLARGFAEAVDTLPAVSGRVVFQNKAKGLAYTEAEAAQLSDGEAQGLEKMELSEEYYYTTRYGSPLSYGLPLDLLGAQGVDSLQDKKLLDYGYGYIGHLRMLAAIGAEAHGVDVNPVLRALYSRPEDTGTVAGRAGGPAGKVVLHHGRFPEQPDLTAEIGSGYHVFLSKNTLKLGYVHPAQPVDPSMTLQLYVKDAEYVRAVWQLLAPGGYVLIYNLYPAQKPPGEGYLPWADGQSPFPRAVWVEAGFEILAFDQDDSARARQYARALGWDQGEEKMDLENDLFALYTLVRKPPVTR
jgi:hypothetical protein